MPTGWQNSNRAARLPPNWDTIRAAVLRDASYRCETLMRNGTRCHDRATEVDHIIAGDNHDRSNLQAICTWHHRRKTAAEANAARQRNRAQRTGRREQQHPGLID